jgi:MATE family multidrug resistance protein
MAGKIGNDAIAGIALGSTTWFLLTFILSGVLLGLNPIVSQANGSADSAKIASALQQSFLLCLIMVVPALFVLWNSDTLFALLGQPPKVAAQSTAYLRAISWGLLPAFGYMALRATLEGLSDTRPILVTSVVCVGLNVLANYTLMFGHFGFPRLELVGAGYASAIVLLCAFLMLLFYFVRTYPELIKRPRARLLDGPMMLEVLRIGIPIGMTIGFEIGMFSAAALAMGRFGVDELAAHQIVLQTASITFMVPLGIAIALSVRVGQAIGAGDTRRAQVAGYVGIATAGAVMCVSATAYLAIPAFIIGLYISFEDPANANVIRWAFRFFAIAAMFQIFDGLQVAASNALRGLKDTRAAMVLTLLAYWGFGATSGWLLAFVFGFGPLGLWYGITIGLASAAIFLIMRYRWYFKQR